MPTPFAPSDDWYLAWADGELVLVGPADEAPQLFPNGRPVGSYVARINEADHDVLIVPNVRREKSEGGYVSLVVPPADWAPTRIRRAPPPRVRKVAPPSGRLAPEPPRRVSAASIDVRESRAIPRLGAAELDGDGTPRRRFDNDPPRIIRQNARPGGNGGSPKYASPAPPVLAVAKAKKAGRTLEWLQRWYWVLQNPIVLVPVGIIVLTIFYFIFKGPIDTLFACMQGMNTRGCRIGMR